jgi:hypothetical protein
MSDELISRHCLATSLYEEICGVLDSDFHYSAFVSYRICEEIIIHYRRDIDRLYAMHGKYLHPTKHCSYYAFWIRKLKPISKAYPVLPLQEPAKLECPLLETEDTAINEKLALVSALRSLQRYIADGSIKFPNGTDISFYLKEFDKYLIKYFESVDVTDSSMGNRMQTLIYDLRYRTFGPHHLTHVLTHIIHEVSHAWPE